LTLLAEADSGLEADQAKLYLAAGRLPAYDRARLLLKSSRPEAAAAIEEVLDVTTRIGIG